MGSTTGGAYGAKRAIRSRVTHTHPGGDRPRTPGMTSAPDRAHPPRLLGGLAGLLAGGAGLAVAEAVSALLEGTSSPLVAVGNRVVDAAPRPVKEWAVATFGEADKPVLVAGVVAAAAAVAFLVGVVAVSRRRRATGILLLLGAVAGTAVLTDRAASAGPLVRLVPVAALVIVTLATLGLLLRAATSGTPGDELPAGFDRRTFLRTALAVGVVAAGGGVIARTYGGARAAASRLAVGVPVPDVAAPGLSRSMTLAVPGITPHLTPNRDFYRVDTALRVPDVPVESWRLRVHGMVDRELDLSFEDLLSRRLVERRITLTCVSNPVGGEYVGNATWIGVPVRELLREAGVHDAADAVRSTSADDFTAGTPLEALLDDGRDALLAVAMNGEPLPLEHGFPVRMVTPGLYGYVSATKWLIDLEVTLFADFEAYWTTRGYAAEAPIKTSSRIDVPRSFARVRPGRTAVAGVAWSQDRGIEAVEVRVDGGPWSRARLAEEDNLDTWRQWVWQWDATPGTHRLEVRATDRTGHTQTAERAPIAPDGSTGWHSVNVTVEG
jgi:DMSO/TMAO reductase YedYZ molybdopterin-dependent catalytic subunit